MLLTPRCGVGLNELSGGKKAGEGEGLTHLRKTKVWMPERAPTILVKGTAAAVPLLFLTSGLK